MRGDSDRLELLERDYCPINGSHGEKNGNYLNNPGGSKWEVAHERNKRFNRRAHSPND